MTVAGVVLAAGEGRRFRRSLTDRPGGPGVGPGADGESVQPAMGAGRTHKLLAPFRGRPLAAWAIEAASGAGFDRLYVVSGAVDLGPLVHEVTGGAGRVLPNPDWAQGQATSLAAAVDAATAADHRAIVVGLADQPLVPPSAWRAVGAAAGDIVTATYDGRRRPPVKLERTIWRQLPRHGDDGARTLMRVRPELVSELPCRGNPVDIDTLEDLQQWS